MFVHFVMFWLNEPNNQEVRKSFEAGLERLVKIENIRQYHLGKPAGTPREVVDSSYTYSLLVYFDDKEQHDIYQDHPEHHVFINSCKQYWNRVQIFDSVPY